MSDSWEEDLGSGPLAALLGEVARTPEPAAELASGDRVGSFRILGRLGAGGMGVVYLAEDPRLDRRVALKIHRAEAGGQERLAREARALALLAHPNVVAVHEVGTFEDDRVFIAMEYVQGATLRRWLGEAPRSGPQIVAAFVAAGRGLAAAHAAGLVHRDFKPENVMVGADGRLRVTDFGLACSPDDAQARPDLEAPLVRITQTGALLGTPAYMAPEQLLGDKIDARADQFAFATALWEAFYEVRPFSGSTPREMIAAVRAGQPRPGTPRAAVPRRVRSVLQRGLAFEPAHRFPDLDALLAALERGMQANRRRARQVSALGGALAVALGAWLLARDPPCQDAELGFEAAWSAEAAERLQAAIRASPVPYAASAASRAAARLDAYGASWAAGRLDACRAARIEHRHSDHVMDLRMACLERRRGFVAALVPVLAEAPLEERAERALEATARLPSLADCEDAELLASPVPLPDDPAARAVVRRLRVSSEEAAARIQAGAYAPAAEQLEALVPEVEATGYAPLAAEVLLRRGVALGASGEYARSEQALRAAALAAASGRDDRSAAEAWVELMLVLSRQNRVHEALFTEPVASGWVRRAGAPGELTVRLERFAGTVYLEAGRPADAALRYRQALELAEAALGPEHLEISRALSNLGLALHRLGEDEPALASFVRAREVALLHLPSEHPELAKLLDNEGLSLRALGRKEEALERHREALAIREAALPEGHPDVATSLNNLSATLWDLGRYAEYRPLIERALEIRRARLGPDHPRTATLIDNLGLAWWEDEQFEKARALHQQALQIRRRSLGPESLEVALSLINIGGTYLEEGRFQEALEPLREGYQIQRQLPADHRGLIYTRYALGHALAEVGAIAEATALLEQALAQMEATGAGKIDRAEARLALALALWRQGRDPARARALLSRGLEECAAPDPRCEKAKRATRRWAARFGLR